MADIAGFPIPAGVAPVKASTICTALREVLPAHARLPARPAAPAPLAADASAEQSAARDQEIAAAAVAHAAACAAARAAVGAIDWESTDGAAVAAAGSFVQNAPTPALSAMCTIFSMAGPIGAGGDAATLVADCRVRVDARLALLREEAARARAAEDAARALSLAGATKAGILAQAKDNVRAHLKLTSAASASEAYDVLRETPKTQLGEAAILSGPDGLAWLASARDHPNFLEHAAAMLLRFLGYPEHPGAGTGTSSGGGTSEAASSSPGAVVRLRTLYADRVRAGLLNVTAAATSSMLARTAGIPAAGTVTLTAVVPAAAAMAAVDGNGDVPITGTRVIVTPEVGREIREAIDNGAGVWVSSAPGNADGIVYGDVDTWCAAIASVDFMVLPPISAVVRNPYSRDGAIDTRGASRLAAQVAVVAKLMHFLRNLIGILPVRRDDLDGNVSSLALMVTGAARTTKDAVALAEGACMAAGRTMPPFSSGDEYALVASMTRDLLLHGRATSIAHCATTFLDSNGGEAGLSAIARGGRRTLPVLYLDPSMVAETQRARAVAFERALTFKVAAAHQTGAHVPPAGTPAPHTPPLPPPRGGAGGDNADPSKNEQGSRFVSLGTIRDPNIRAALGGGSAPPTALSARVPATALATVLAAATTPAPPGAILCFSQFAKDHATCKTDGQACPRRTAGGRKLHHINDEAVPTLAAAVEWYIPTVK